MTPCIVMTALCIYLRRNQLPFILLCTRNKRVAITCHENQILNLGNQDYNDATKAAPGITEKFEEPLIVSNITS